jgi:transposase
VYSIDNARSGVDGALRHPADALEVGDVLAVCDGLGARRTDLSDDLVGGGVCLALGGERERVHADYLRIRPRPRRDGNSTLTFMRQIRLAYPRRIRIYWIQDGLSSHWTPAIRSFAAANNIELVPTPTYASYLNRIEATFGAIDEFVRKNADYLDWDSFGHALADHVRHRKQPRRTRTTTDRSGKKAPTPRRHNDHRPQARRLSHARVSGATVRDAALDRFDQGGRAEAAAAAHGDEAALAVGSL